MSYKCGLPNIGSLNIVLQYDSLVMISFLPHTESTNKSASHHRILLRNFIFLEMALASFIQGLDIRSVLLLFFVFFAVVFHQAHGDFQFNCWLVSTIDVVSIYLYIHRRTCPGKSSNGLVIATRVCLL